MLLGGCHLDEEVAARNGRAGIAHFTGARLLLLTAALAVALLGLSSYLDMQIIGRDGLATNRHMSRRNGKRTILRCRKNISISDAGRTRRMAVDHLETRLCGRAGTHEHIEGIRDVTSTEVPGIVGIDGIAQAELFTHSHLSRSTARQ